ncbi:hypothetical protein BDU57DRAFT_508724 [Ampelomyces quisqualis]|uniref:Uncharacterized protein n=1 Tax=Ampelomyces quisqualis TaxID=50730 RepID=A0A6A5QYC7_AMPQU|nr:hypothetical protein BDU57DRAFT_508724 [Ampelomyces quisqualis]
MNPSDQTTCPRARRVQYMLRYSASARTGRSWMIDAGTPCSTIALRRASKCPSHRRSPRYSLRSHAQGNQQPRKRYPGRVLVLGHDAVGQGSHNYKNSMRLLADVRPKARTAANTAPVAISPHAPSLLQRSLLFLFQRRMFARTQSAGRRVSSLSAPDPSHLDSHVYSLRTYTARLPTNQRLLSACPSRFHAAAACTFQASYQHPSRTPHAMTPAYPSMCKYVGSAPTSISRRSLPSATHPPSRTRYPMRRRPAISLSIPCLEPLFAFPV